MEDEEPEIIDFAQLPCLRCRQITNYVGRMPIRTRGVSGIWNFVIGDLAGLGEEVLQLDVYRCTHCGHMEFFDFDMKIPELPPQEEPLPQE